MTKKTSRSISMDIWRKLAAEGSAPAVTICLDGDSMRPLIRRGRDPVTIVPLIRDIRVGDMVLFCLGDRYIVHRVWKIEADRVRTLGDNCLWPEPWFPRTQVIGQVIKFSRNGKTYRLDTASARFYGRVWMATHPLRACYKRLRAFAGRCYRKIFPGRGKG